MEKKIDYVGLFPIIIINLFPIIGVLKLGWLIGDVFLWFYFDLLISFIFIYLRLRLFWNCNSGRSAQMVKMEKNMYIWSFFIIFIFATIFCLLPVKAQWGRYGTLGNFISQKFFTMMFIIITGWVDLKINYSDARIYKETDFDRLTMPLAQRAAPIIILYGILMLHYHITGAHELTLNGSYTMAMFLILVLGKCLVDCVMFWKYGPKEQKIQF